MKTKSLLLQALGRNTSRFGRLVLESRSLRGIPQCTVKSDMDAKLFYSLDCNSYSTPHSLLWDDCGGQRSRELNDNFQEAERNLLRYSRLCHISISGKYGVPTNGMLNFSRRYAMSASGSSRREKDNNEAPDIEQRRVNRAITSRMVRLVTESGHEILPTYLAIRKAESCQLDLMEVNGKMDPPVCRLVDYKKFRFEERRREKEQRKKQLEKRRMDGIKEVRTGSRTEMKDLQMKTDTALKLLERGHRVKLTIQFKTGDKERGVGLNLLSDMLRVVELSAKIEAGPREEVQRSWAIVRPVKVVKKEFEQETMFTDVEEQLDLVEKHER